MTARFPVSNKNYTDNDDATPAVQERPLHLLIGGAVLGVGALVALTASVALPAGLAWQFLHPPRKLHVANPRSALGLEYERVRFRTPDGVTLRGWFVPAPDGIAARGMAILCHGYVGNRGEMLAYLQMLHDAGFAAFLFDFRAHGWSGGQRTTFGLHECGDLTAAIEWTTRIPEIADLPLILLGESMGAAVALMTAADDERVRAVIADSPFARFDAAVEARLKLFFGPVAPVVTPRTRRFGERILGVGCETIAPEDAIARIAPRPILLIQGQKDRVVTPDNARRLYTRSPQNITLWEVPNAPHVRSIYLARAEYEQKVKQFLQSL